jgi:expansin (peptidoglycan-binding protein)
MIKINRLYTLFTFLQLLVLIKLSNQCDLPIKNNNEIFTGDATAYGGGNTWGFCGFKEKSFLYSNKIEVALNSVQWNNSLNCGRCVNIYYENNPPIKALISDKCPECKYGDLDLFLESYSIIIKKNPGREKIQWNFITCDEFIDGKIRFRIDYINYYWLSINPENFLCGIANLEISFGNNWIQLERNDNSMSGLYFNFNGYINTPFQLKITSINHEILITEKYYTIDHILSTNFQFKC